MAGGVVIVGGGVIGASTAYHLGQLGVRSTVVERRGVACAASGRAGGFLARDWCDGSPLRALARASFPMHARLADDLPADVGYRALDAYSADISPARGTRPRLKSTLWLDGPQVQVRAEHAISRPASAAQVHPAKLTRALMDAARAAVGTEVLLDTVVGVVREGARVVGVETTANGVVPCDTLVIAMGPWTVSACKWFDALAPIMANKATSIVLRAAVPAQAIFCEYTDRGGVSREPEIYPREDEVYVCGSAQQDPLPEDPEDISARPEDAQVLESFVKDVSSTLADAPVLQRQSCYLPLSPDGIPMIGRIPRVDNAFVAAGHGCWGILNSPATGIAMAELIVHGKSSTVDISAFDPSRFGSRARRKRH